MERPFPRLLFWLHGENGNVWEEVLKQIPLDRLLLVTDVPYLPMLKGSKTTTSAYIGDVAACVALVRQEPINLVVWANRANGRRLYSY